MKFLSKSQRRLSLAVLLAGSSGVFSAAFAETMDHAAMGHDSMPAMDHSAMDQGAMDHSQMNHAATGMEPPSMQEMDHSGMDHGQMSQADMPMNHAGMDHSQMNHPAPVATSESRTPIPVLTDADRAAAFPDVHGHKMHDNAINSLVLFDQLEYQNAHALMY